MRPLLPILGLLFVSACAKTVRVEVPARPAVPLQATSMAVVSLDRLCRPFADALAESLTEQGMRIDPASKVRVNVLECGHTFETEVMVDQKTTSEGVTTDRRRVTVDGRGHAVAAVQVGEAHNVEAHLIGASRTQLRGGWQQTNLVGLNRAAESQLVTAVARDLASQVSPMPWLVERRTYPNAADGSARQLHTAAVRAEISGDITEAHQLAIAANAAHPTARSAAYIAELERRILSTSP